jgi:hypothetical protein
MTYICMPLQENVPHPKNRDWRLTVCPSCGRNCWDHNFPQEVYQLAGLNQAPKLCTECAIRKTTYPVKKRRKR